MTTTLLVARTGLSQVVGDYWSNAPSANSGDASGVTDTDLSPWPNSWFNGWWSLLRPGASRNIKRVTGFTSSTGIYTVTPNHDATPLTTMTYELHKYDPGLKTEALNEAATELYFYLFKVDYDQVIVTVNNQWQYTPTADIINIRNIKYQVDTTYTDSPYRQLCRGRDWDWRNNEGTAKIQFYSTFGATTPSSHLEICHVKPLEVLTADTDVATISDADDLRLWYTVAARILYEKLASASVGEVRRVYTEEATKKDAFARILKGRCRNRWPSDYYMVGGN